ncbi:MAG TPA: hypothetical protein VFT16_05370 [Candidatus Saccharimonadales bacterium]|nr:hypothetical protein [Candidatus Saccharimonadales bacterium]
MHILRKAVVVIVCSLLPMVLLGFGILFSLFQVLGSASHIKGALDSSGVYDSAIASVVKQTTNTQNSSETQSSDGEAAVRQAVKDAIPASYIKEQTDGVLDGIYDWMSGKTASLDFTIDLTPVKTALVDNLTEQARERARTLPACGPADLTTTSTDPFSASCLPAGTNPDQIAEQTRQTVLDSDIFKQSSITPQNMQQGDSKPIEEELAAAKDGYQAVKKALYLTGLLAMIFIAAAIFLSQPRVAGVKRVAYILLSVGAIGIITAVIGGAISHTLVDNIAKDSSGELPIRIAQVVRILVDDIRNWWITLGSLSVGISVGALVAEKVWQKKHAAPSTQENTPIGNQPPGSGLPPLAP